MNTPIRVLVLALAVAGLGACAKKTVKPEDTTPPPTSTTTQTTATQEESWTASRA